MRVGLGTSMPLPKVAENVSTEHPFEEGNSTFSRSLLKPHFSGKTGRKFLPSRGSSALRYQGRSFPKLKQKIKPKINVMTISALETSRPRKAVLTCTLHAGWKTSLIKDPCTCASHCTSMEMGAHMQENVWTACCMFVGAGGWVGAQDDMWVAV